MIAIVVKGQPLCSAFYSVYSMAETLCLFSRCFGFFDVFVYHLPSKDAPIDQLHPLLYLPKKKFMSLIRSYDPKSVG